MSCGVYKIENLINGKVYIGQSINIKRRWRAHRTSKKQSSLLSKDIFKYGVKNFSFCILEECDEGDLHQRERFYVKQFNSFYNGYNMTTGGAGSHNHELKLSNDDILEIHLLLKESEMSQQCISDIFNVGEDTISEINKGKSRRLESITYPIRKIEKKRFFCKDCRVEVSYGATRCLECNNLFSQKTTRPTKEILEKELKEFNFLKVAKLYGVSDTAVRKWCKSYGISTSSKDYK